MSPDIPTVDEVLTLHTELIERFGGSHGLRDRGALESALGRPIAGYFDNLIDMAAALMESLAMNHPFVDGNKRVAFIVTDVFLRMNGHYIECDDEAAYSHFMRLFETGAFRFTELRSWLRAHVKLFQAEGD